MTLNATPRANRLHIAIFGKRNAGKSSLINALTGQQIALVSEHAGTTTDPVFKSMELHPVGPVVFIDTAGFDDVGELGQLRVEKTREVIDKTDIAIMIFDGSDFTMEADWLQQLEKAKIPVIPIVGKADLETAGNQNPPANAVVTETGNQIAAEDSVVTESCNQGVDSARMVTPQELCALIKQQLDLEPLLVSAQNGTGLEAVRDAIAEVVPEDYKRRKILGDLVADGELVLLVMPQDIQAPKGRLILPQVQTIRELLDNRCTTVCTTADRFEQALGCLAKPPALIITDSQCFKQIYEQKPEVSELTSFSVLFAAYKGDIHEFAAGAATIDALTENSRVLIAEACTHAPLEEDIGRVKIPAALRKRIGAGLTIDMVAGQDFPGDPSEYDLIIHCGACMFNRAHVMSRIAKAKAAGVPITNYGITMAKLSGILDKIQLPE